VQRGASVRAFVATGYGKLALGLLALATLALSFYYLGPYFAIPTFLLFGLGVPIYLGWKVPRQLAVMGIVVILATGPLINWGLTGQAMTPSPMATSATDRSNTSSGNPVLANATEAPYNAPGGTSFVFSVDMYTNRLPANTTPYSLELFVSTCPGATGNSSPFCGTGYPFYPVNQSVVNVTGSPAHLAFHVALPGPNIWWWQLGLLAKTVKFIPAKNTTNTSYQWIFLAVSNPYGAVQGPVTGTWLSTYKLLLTQTILDVLFYPGLVFYAALLVYLFLKSREARRKAQRGSAGSATIPPTSGSPASSGPPMASLPPGPGSPSSAGGSKTENACPKCGAVVYPKETNCWKCGAPLTAPSNAPLSSGPA
jgi:hypothetical protein